MELDWHKFDVADLKTHPPDQKEYFMLTDGILTIGYFQDKHFHFIDDIALSDYGCSAWLENQPDFWAELPSFNYPDEVLIEMIN
tara:strand:- start:144 stop:395 length:252 start_codon:yes stop_codon:yes gene_type:complete